MCGRFTQTKEQGIVERQFLIDLLKPVSPRYNIAPSQHVLAVRLQPEAGKREGSLLRWGLIPSWAKDATIGHRLINARAETVAVKPAFRSAFRHRRCLIPADGFYEWQKTPERGFDRRKQPYQLRFKDERLFAFAGLWEQWTKHNGQLVETCTIVTTTPNALTRQVHDRMPVILDEKDYEAWLDPAVKNTESLQALLRPYAFAKDMIGMPIATWVNSPRIDDARCIEHIKVFDPIEV